MVCKFKKYYKEPTEKYVCLSTSLFYKEQYIKMSRDLKPYNATKNKVNYFYKNLKILIKKIDDGTYPSNFYLRLYYDKSINKIGRYVELIKELKKNPKVQLIEYECDSYKNKHNVHIDLFGTLIRFYTIFDKDKSNIEYTICIDSDNYFTDKFIEIYNNFKKSKKLIYVINRLTQISFHGNDFNRSDTLFDFIYLLAGCVIIKKDKIFKYEYWDKYFNKMFEQQDLTYVYNYIDFKRYAINSILEKNDIKPQSYYSFNYGTDEIWLNFVLKEILIQNKKEKQLDVYLTKDFNMKFLITRLTDMFHYNKLVNKEEYELFTSINKKDIILEIQDIPEIDFNNIEFIDNFFSKIIKNKYYNRLYIQNSIKYIINNYKILLKNRNQYKYNEIIQSKLY
jgi:hypothetical protein